MPLSGKQLKQTQDALLDAYATVDDLRMLVRFELNENLNAVAGGDNLRVVVFNLLAWAEQHGRVADLITAACAQRPGNAALAKLQSEATQWFAAGPATVTPPITPPLTIEWITIPAGPFLMGSDKSKDKMAHDDEQPQHSVHLPEYHIARVPITNAQYLQFMRAAGQRTPGHWANEEPPPDKANHPVVNVTWHDARAYGAWASKVSGCNIRLPSAAEWEKAARGVDGRIWPWGDEPPNAARCNFRNIVGGTTAVNAYPHGASPYGALDMAGNVWEWTNSWGDKYPYAAADNEENPSGQGDNSLRILRGGAFDLSEDRVRCAACGMFHPLDDFWSLGFRVVLFTSASDR
jgi:formylglycine-generating enzyme required for sulfatase activity